MKIVTNDKNAVQYNVPMAKAARATRDDIKEILLSLRVNGLKGISNYLAEALESYDNS